MTRPGSSGTTMFSLCGERLRRDDRRIYAPISIQWEVDDIRQWVYAKICLKTFTKESEYSSVYLTEEWSSASPDFWLMESLSQCAYRASKTLQTELGGLDFDWFVECGTPWATLQFLCEFYEVNCTPKSEERNRVLFDFIIRLFLPIIELINYRYMSVVNFHFMTRSIQDYIWKLTQLSKDCLGTSGPASEIPLSRNVHTALVKCADYHAATKGSMRRTRHGPLAFSSFSPTWGTLLQL